MSRDLERFLEHVDQSGDERGCHVWTGPTRNEKGYGAFRVGGRTVVAHRWLLGELRGRPLAWPEEIGCHRCDNPRCCNPEHLYIGTHRDNTFDAIERSGHPAAAWRGRTRCQRGHDFTPENTMISSGRRICRECHRTKNREAARRRRQAKGVKVRNRRPNGQFDWSDPAGVAGG